MANMSEAGVEGEIALSPDNSPRQSSQGPSAAPAILPGEGDNRRALDRSCNARGATKDKCENDQSGLWAVFEQGHNTGGLCVRGALQNLLAVRNLIGQF